MSQVIPVVACVIEHEGRFLITQRHQHSHLGHLWEFPGGKIEAGESTEACAIRECEEELGIQVQPVELITELTHHYSERSVHLYFMACRWVSGEPEALDCADWVWASPDEFPNYEFPEADREVVDQYIHGRKSVYST